MALVNKFCIICNKEFKVNFARKNSAKFCSHKCYGQSLKGKKYHKTGELKNCKICNKEFYVPPSFKSQKFCSPNCYYKSKKENIPSNKGVKYSDEKKKNILKYSKIFKKGDISHNKGKAHSAESKKKMRETLGRLHKEGKIKIWNKGLKLDKEKYSHLGFQKGHKFYEGGEKSWFTSEQMKGNDFGFKKGDLRLIGNQFAKGISPINKLTIPKKQELKNLYEIENRDAREIAKIYNTNMKTVLDWLKYHNIQKRSSLYGYNQKIFCKAGHRVDSIGERKIADFLFDNGIGYLHNKVISKNNKILKRYDFFLPDFDIYLEYLGLKGKDFYDKRTEEKIEIYKSLGLNVIWIIPGENIQKRLDFLNIRPLSKFSDRNIN